MGFAVRGSAGLLALAVAATLEVVTSRPAHAQHVLLQLRPHVGDTLHMRIDQEVDITGSTSRPTGDSISSVTTTLFALARMIVAGSDSAGTDLVVVVDSMAQWTSGAPRDPPTTRHRMSCDGRSACAWRQTECP